MNRLLGILLGAMLLAATIAERSPAQDSNWVSLFDGVDLAGWIRVNCAPETFSVRDAMIVCTGFPTGVLRSDKQYENFILELEWRHMKAGGNAGLFVWSDPLPAPGVPFTRGIEVQILDGRNSDTYTSHGDVFPIHGAVMTPDRPHPSGSMRCLPSERRCKPAGEWNHYRVTCVDGVIKLAVNGKEVSGGSKCSPRKGYICLESEGSETHFRNLRIQELPGGNATALETAPQAQDFRPLYTGLDLTGWRQADAHAGHWRPEDWKLVYDGQSEAADKNLWTEKEYGDFELICDWRLTREPVSTPRPLILESGDYDLDAEGNPKLIDVPDAGDSGILLRGSEKSQVNISCWPAGSGEVYGYRTDRNQPAEVRAGVTPLVKADNPTGEWNRFAITLRGDRLTVDLNGQRVIDNAQLPGIRERGPIGLQHHGDAVEFANLFVWELKR